MKTSRKIVLLCLSMAFLCSMKAQACIPLFVSIDSEAESLACDRCAGKDEKHKLYKCGGCKRKKTKDKPPSELIR
jgi:hypothetical protein